jgi:hypothetical protein
LKVAHCLFQTDSAELFLCHDCNIEPSAVDVVKLLSDLGFSSSIQLIIDKLLVESAVQFLAQSLDPGDEIGRIGNDGSYHLSKMTAFLSCESSGLIVYITLLRLHGVQT